MKLSTQLRNSLASQLAQAPKRREEIKTHAKALNKLQRLVAKFDRSRISAYVGCTSAVQVYIDIPVTSFNERAIVKLLAKIDDIAPFDNSHDNVDGRTFSSYRPFYLTVKLSINNPDEAKCRRVIKEVRPGSPEIVYGYECA